MNVSLVRKFITLLSVCSIIISGFYIKEHVDGAWRQIALYAQQLQSTLPFIQDTEYAQKIESLSERVTTLEEKNTPVLKELVTREVVIKENPSSMEGIYYFLLNKITDLEGNQSNQSTVLTHNESVDSVDSSGVPVKRVEPARRTTTERMVRNVYTNTSEALQAALDALRESFTTKVLTVDGGTGVVGTFSGRVVGQPAASSTEFTTLGQVNDLIADATSTLPFTYFAQDGNSFGAVATLGTNDNNSLAFETNDTERLRIDTLGNVGVGTATPSHTLHIAGTPGTPNIRFESLGSVSTTSLNTTDSLVYTTNTGLLGSISASNLVSSQGWTLTGNTGTNPTTNFIGTRDAQDFALRTNNTERMRILSNGNVGIGTTAPTNLLTVGNPTTTTNTDPTLRIQGQAISNGTVNYGSYGSMILNANTGYTTSARRYLVTNALNLNKFAIIRSTDATTDPSLGVAGALSSGVADFVINNSGNVGIGTTNPTSKSHIYGTSNISQTIETTSGTTDLFLKTGTANEARITFVQSGADKWQAGSNSVFDFFWYNYTQGGVQLRLKADGNTNLNEFSGKVGIGGTHTPTAMLDVRSRTATDTTAIFQGASAQTADLTEWRNGSGTTVAEVLADGTIRGLRLLAYGSGGITTNTAIGTNSLQSNTTGTSNTAIGTNSLQSNTTGTSNTAIGVSSLLLNTTGTSNTAIGTNSLQSNTTGTSNTAIGVNSLKSNTTGTSNTAIGVSSLLLNTTGTSNTAIGTNSLQSNTTGTSNTAIGVNSLLLNTTGTSNTAIGVSSLYSNTTGTSNTAIGVNSLLLNTTGTSNTAIGTNSLQSNTTGTSNTAIGVSSLYANTTGTSNTAIGVSSLYANTIGVNNTAIGTNSLLLNTTGTSNTAIGVSSLLLNTTGTSNTAIGVNSLKSNTTGNYNVSLGFQSLYNNTTGNQNVAIGFNTGYELNLTASENGNNVFLGYNTGRGIVTGVNNTILGANVTGLSSSLSNNIIIADGDGNRRINVDASGNVGIGTTTPSTQLHTTGGVRFSYFGAGTLQSDALGNVSVSSDERLKNVQGTYNRGLADLIGINPIAYNWKAETGYDTASTYYGFSAQNVQAFVPEAVGMDDKGMLTLQDRPLLAASINALKELNIRIGDIENNVTIPSTSSTLSNAFDTFIENGKTIFNNLFTRRITIIERDNEENMTGEGVILSGNNSVYINNSLITPTSRIIITPTAPLEGREWYVSEKTSGRFELRLDGNAHNDITFDYMIVSVDRTNRTSYSGREGDSQSSYSTPAPAPEPPVTPEPAPEPTTTPEEPPASDPTPEPPVTPEPAPEPTPDSESNYNNTD